MATYWWVNGSGAVSSGANWSVIGSGGAAFELSSVTSITSALGSATGTLTETPTSGTNDDGYFSVTLPWNVTYFSTSYSTVHVGTNSYLTFGTGSTTYSVSASNPGFPKIMYGSADHSVQRVYTETTGTTPNRIFRIRAEGTNSTSGTAGSPTIVVEFYFYENTPNQIEFQTGVHNNLTGSLWGVYTSTNLVISITAAINSRWRIITTGTGAALSITSTDDIVFDSNSGASPTVIFDTNLTCNNITIGNPTSGSFTFNFQSVTSRSLTFNGNWSNTHSSLTFSNAASSTGIVYSGTGTNTISNNSVLCNFNVSGTGTLTSNSNFDLGTNTLNVNSGTFNTNNFNVTALSLTGSSTCTLTLGTSTLNLSGTSPFSISSGINLSALNSTLNFSGSISSFTLPNNTSLGTVNFNNTTSGTTNLIGSVTFRNLLLSGAIGGVRAYTLANNITVSGGTLTCAGQNGSDRLSLISSVLYSQRTITISNTPSLTDVDFRDIRIIGIAGTITGTRIGNAGGNDGITFPASKTVYYAATGGTTWGSNSWSASSGGGVSIDNFPLPQDTAIIDNAAPTAGATLTINGSYHICSLDSSTRTNSLTLSLGAFSIYFIGDFLHGSGVSTGGGTATLLFYNRSIRTLSVPAASTSFAGSITIETLNGGLSITGGALRSNGDITVVGGTFTTNNNAVFTTKFTASSSSSGKTLNFGTSTFTLNGTSTVWSIPESNVNFSGTPSITTTNLGGTTIEGGGYTYGSITIAGGGTSASLNGNNNISSLTLTWNGTSGFNTFAIGGNQTITGSVNLTGAANNKKFFIQSNTIGTQRTISVGTTWTGNTDINFRDIRIIGSISPLTGTRIGNCFGNNGITFDAPTTRYWNNSAGGAYFSASWANSIGGAVSFDNYPLPQDTAIFEDTGLSASGVITLYNTLIIGTIDASSRTLTMTFSTAFNPGSGLASVFTYSVHGNLICSSAVTFSAFIGFTFPLTSTFQFWSRNGANIDVVNTMTASIQILSYDSTVNLLRNLNNWTSNAGVYLNTGTFNLNNFNITTGLFQTLGTLPKRYIFGTSNSITLNGTGSILQTGDTVLNLTASNLTVTNGNAVTFNVSNNNRTKIVSGGFLGENNSPNISISGIVIISGSFNNFTHSPLNFTNFPTVTVYGNFSGSTSLYSSTGTLTVASTSAVERTITGIAGSPTLIVNGVGGNFRITQASATFTNITLTNGTLNLNGLNIFTSTFSTGAGTKNLTFNGSILSVSGSGTTAFNNQNPSGFTTTAGTGTGIISMTSTLAKTFVGGGSVYNCTVRQGNSGALTITGSNTFDNFTNNINNVSIIFQANTLNTFNNWSVNGSGANRITIRSTTAGQSYTLFKSSGTISSNSIDLQDSIATGGAVWRAYITNNNINSGGNSGWYFYLDTASRGYIIT